MNIAICWNLLERSLPLVHGDMTEMNTKQILSFLPLINKSVTTGWRFILLVTSAIITSNIFYTFLFAPGF